MLEFCQKFNKPVMLADSIHVQACLTRTLHLTQSVPAVQAFASSIVHYHRINGFNSPTTHSEPLGTFMQGIKKSYSLSRNSALPSTVEHLNELVKKLYSVSSEEHASKAPLKCGELFA